MEQIVRVLEPNQPLNNEHVISQVGEAWELIIIFIAKNQEKIEIDTRVCHKDSSSQTRTLVRGVLFDEAQAVVKGIIEVEKKAIHTQAYLEQKVLLMDEAAQAEVIPQLEISGHEVKVSHAATVGKLDEEQLFYLMSRGCSEEMARHLLVRGFFQPLMDKCHRQHDRDNLEKYLLNRLSNETNIGSTR